MLPSENRLKDRRDFGKVYEKGLFFSLSGLTVRLVPNTLAITRIGFSISKSFSKKAVERNRIRRLLREACRLKMPSIRPGFDIVISYGSKIKNPTLAELSRSLDHLLQKGRLLH